MEQKFINNKLVENSLSRKEKSSWEQDEKIPDLSCNKLWEIIIWKHSMTQQIKNKSFHNKSNKKAP